MKTPLSPLLEVRWIVLLLAIIVNFSQGQDLHSKADGPDRVKLDSLLTVINDLKTKQELSNYSLQILEKTNNQLSLWWNPYGVLISALALLFAFLTIVATFLLFRQSREYRSMITSSIANYRGLLNAFIEEKKLELDSKIKETQDKLSKASDDHKKEITETLTRLQKSKDSLDNRFANTLEMLAGPITPSDIFAMTPNSIWVSRTQNVTITCEQCGHQFSTIKRLGLPDDRTASVTVARCPKCDHQNYV